MRLTPEEPRQAPGVWQAWNKLLLPPADTHSVMEETHRGITAGGLAASKYNMSCLWPAGEFIARSVRV